MPSRLPAVVGRGNPACFIVSDASGQALAYVYYEEEPEPARRVARPQMARECQQRRLL